MLVELTVGSLALAAYIANKHRNKKYENIPPHIAATREVVFDTAINGVRDPKVLRELANAFRAQKMDVQADMLDQRAELATQPVEQKLARREVYRKALESKDPAAINLVADAFEKVGAMGAANTLRIVASGLSETAVEMGNES